MITMLPPRRVLAALLVFLCACALPAAAQPRQTDPALPPESPPPLTAPGLGNAREPDQRSRDTFEADEEKLRESMRTDEFVPISELPPEEQLPAAPMLVAAYVFVVLALFAYLLSVSRRLGVVRQEITRLEAETRRTGPR